MNKMGNNFDFVYHNKRTTEDRIRFIDLYDNTPENLIESDEVVDVSDKIIISLECSLPDEKIPEIIGALIPREGEKLEAHIGSGGHFAIFFKLFRDNELIAIFAKDDEPFIMTWEEYLEDFKETQGDNLAEERLFKTIECYVKGHLQDIDFEVTRDKIMIIKGL